MSNEGNGIPQANAVRSIHFVNPNHQLAGDEIRVVEAPRPANLIAHFLNVRRIPAPPEINLYRDINQAYDSSEDSEDDSESNSATESEGEIYEDDEEVRAPAEEHAEGVVRAPIFVEPEGTGQEVGIESGEIANDVNARDSTAARRDEDRARARRAENSRRAAAQERNRQRRDAQNISLILRPAREQMATVQVRINVPNEQVVEASLSYETPEPRDTERFKSFVFERVSHSQEEQRGGKHVEGVVAMPSLHESTTCTTVNLPNIECVSITCSAVSKADDAVTAEKRKHEEEEDDESDDLAGQSDKKSKME